MRPLVAPLCLFACCVFAFGSPVTAEASFDQPAVLAFEQASLDVVNVDADAKQESAQLLDEFAAWYPGKNLRAWRSNARASGRWYPGKNIARAFGRAGSC